MVLLEIATVSGLWLLLNFKLYTCRAFLSILQIYSKCILLFLNSGLLYFRTLCLNFPIHATVWKVWLVGVSISRHFKPNPSNLQKINFNANTYHDKDPVLQFKILFSKLKYSVCKQPCQFIRYYILTYYILTEEDRFILEKLCENSRLFFHNFFLHNVHLSLLA